MDRRLVRSVTHCTVRDGCGGWDGASDGWTCGPLRQAQGGRPLRGEGRGREGIDLKGDDQGVGGGQEGGGGVLVGEGALVVEEGEEVVAGGGGGEDVEGDFEGGDLDGAEGEFSGGEADGDGGGGGGVVGGEE